MITFLLNQQSIKTDAAPGTALLDYIRHHRHLKGAKLVCKEGECGACTVLVGDFKTGKMVYQSMTSCITPLINAHGKHIVTIEGLNDTELTPVQQAMVDQTGTQCGFCTPGFVTSLTGAFLSERALTSFENFVEHIDGNICRCTGYKSIERAAKIIYQQYLEKGAPTEINALVNTGFLPAYFAQVPERLYQLQEQITTQTSQQEKVNQKVGGGTDLYVQRPRQMYEAPVQALLNHSPIKTIEVTNATCRFGAAMTMGDLYYSKVFQEVLPNAEYIFKLLSSTQIRNMATIGGNLVNASPIGDFTILLLALNSQLTLQNQAGQTREIALNKFYHDYKKTDLKEGEIVTHITFDIPQKTKQQYLSFEKVSQRKFLDIASVNCAALITLNEAQDTILDIHLSAGGVAAIPKYMYQTVAFLKGKPFTNDTLTQAIEVLQNEVSPISDTRGSKAYKRLLLRQLFLAHFHRINKDIFNLKELIQS